MKINKVPFEYQSEPLDKIDLNSPYGKLPYIHDSDNNTKVGDTNLIIPYLTKKFNVAIDADMGSAERSIAIAFDRLIGEHLYWSGVIQPRWREDQGFETYIPHIVQGAEVTPELRAALDAFRKRIRDEFNGQGMGRRDGDCVVQFYQADIDALGDYLGQKKYFMGDRVRGIDAAVYAILRQLVDQPMSWKGTGYIESKPNLVEYMARMRKEYNM